MKFDNIVDPKKIMELHSKGLIKWVTPDLDMELSDFLERIDNKRLSEKERKRRSH